MGCFSGRIRGEGIRIGNASSNGTERANADCYALFVALWNGWSALPVYPHNSMMSVARGASAEADWHANRRIELPDMRGRVAAGRDVMGANVAAGRLTNAGTGNPGVNGGTLGAVGGVDRHGLTVGQMPSHAHNGSNFNFYRLGTPAAIAVTGNTSGNARADAVVTASAGGDQEHPNVQPTMVLNYIIKL